MTNQTQQEVVQMAKAKQKDAATPRITREQQEAARKAQAKRAQGTTAAKKTAEKPKVDAAAKAKADAKAELKRINERVTTETGHTTADVNKARSLAEKAGVAVPKWARRPGEAGAPKPMDPDKARRGEIVTAAKAIASSGPAGAFKTPIGTTEVRLIEEYLKGRKPQDVVGLSAPALAKHAAKADDAPTGEKLKGFKEMTASIGNNLVWGRKATAILAAIAGAKPLS